MKLKVFAFADEADKNFNGQIRALIRNGLDGLELRGVNGANVTDLSTRTAKECAKKLKDAGLKVWSIGSPIGKIDIDGKKFASERERLLRTFEIAKVFGTKNIRMFSFFMPKDQDPADYRNKVIEELSRYAEMAKDAGMILCHENEKAIFGDTPERCLDILRSVPGIRAVFDPANFVQCGVDTLSAWEQLHSHVYYLHIKDALKSGLVVPSGDGEGHVAEIVRAYAAQGGKVCTIEPHIMKFVGLSDLERKGDESGVGSAKYSFTDRNEAFDFAVRAFRKVTGEE